MTQLDIGSPYQVLGNGHCAEQNGGFTASPDQWLWVERDRKSATVRRFVLLAFAIALCKEYVQPKQRRPLAIQSWDRRWPMNGRVTDRSPSIKGAEWTLFFLRLSEGVRAHGGTWLVAHDGRSERLQCSSSTDSPCNLDAEVPQKDAACQCVARGGSHRAACAWRNLGVQNAVPEEPNLCGHERYHVSVFDRSDTSICRDTFSWR